MRTLLIPILALLLAGCLPGNGQSFDIRSLAKSDIDMVVDLHRNAQDKLVRRLATKLYKRNPRELAKTPRMTINLRVQQILAPAPPGGYPELQGKRGNDAMALAFSRDYEGDRVFALMTGIYTMLDRAYNHKRQFFILDELDQQKLYNSARNLESVAWQLNHATNASGQPLLLANGISHDGVENLSFERILGKMIALQDMAAEIIADSTNRTIKNVFHSAASMTFLPI